MSKEQPPSPVGPFVTRLEAARVHLRCDVTTIDRRVADGSLPKFKFGRRTLFRLVDVLKLIEHSPVLSPHCGGRQRPPSTRGRGHSVLISTEQAVLFLLLLAAILLIRVYI